MVKRRRFKSTKRGLTGVERYINRVMAAGGSTSFKQWLLSQPMDVFVTKQIKRSLGGIGKKDDELII